MTLDEFLAEVRDAEVNFEREWRRQHAISPEDYPMDIPDDNAGLWWELFFENTQPSEEG